MAKQQIKMTKRPPYKTRANTRSKRDKAPIFSLHEQAVDLGLADLAENYEHYLFGNPKQNAEE